MKRIVCAATVLFSLLSAGSLPLLAQEVRLPRERVSFNADWRFNKGDPANLWSPAQLDYVMIKPWLLPTGAALLHPLAPRPARPPGNLGGELNFVQPNWDDSGWRRLDLPHDWGIEGPFKLEYPGDTGKLPWWGSAWYRKHFALPATDAGRQITLEIDGAMSHSTVWLNGQFVGGWPYGYSSYQLDLTPYVKPGAENVIAIRLDNPTESSRWYPGGGIYRNVWLVKTEPVHVAHWGTFVTTPRVTAEAAVVRVAVQAENELAASADLAVRTELFALDAAGARTGAAVATSDPIAVTIPGHSQASVAVEIAVNQPQRWSIEHPHRYVAVTTLEQAGKIIDRSETPFGIRTAVFEADKGFLLNGEVVSLRGVCDHHDLGALGAAINVRALERQLEILRSFGCNAIRTSHNPPAPELLDACDRLGFVVMDEAFDCWVKGKNRNDYHQLFADWHEQDLRALVRRDRNHPSVVLWSIGNEVPDQGGTEGWKLANQLASIVREEDRTRPVSAAHDNPASGFDGFQLVFDAMGFNYKIDTYGPFHRRFPTIPVFGSETASTISSRGEYFFPLSDAKLDPNARVNFQVSSYDLFAEPWATSPDAEWKAADAVPGYAGEFVWTGFDYLGEPTPYYDGNKAYRLSDPAEQARLDQQLKETGRVLVPSRSSYFGIVDLAGFPKDRYYFYQARWRPNFPMAHILPHWNWPDRVGQVTPVHVYTSGDEAELFLNGHSLGKKKKEPGTYRLRWDDVKYQPGELKVVAYRNGQAWAEDVMRTAGPAAKLLLATDRATVQADGRDLAFVSGTITDKDGTLVPRANQLVRFSLTGPGEIVAVDNGDATSFEPFQASQHRAFNGRVLVIVRTKAGQPGPLVLRAEADGLPATEVALQSTKP